MADIIVRHFETITIPGEQTEDGQPLEVSRWVAEGAILVSREAASAGGSLGKGKELLLGEGADYATDGSGVVQASVTGYPLITIVPTEGGEVHQVGVLPMLELDSQGWLAKVNIYPALRKEDMPDRDVLFSLIAAAGICYGFRSGIIDEILEAVFRDKVPVKGKVVARGRLPVHGRDGYLRLDVDVEEKAGEEMGNGALDYRERNLFVPVDPGQLLATHIPAGLGLAGINVFGEEIPAQLGCKLEVIPGAQTVYDEKTGEIRATGSGIVSVVEGRSVIVTDKSVIESDIDFNTGNIRSTSAVDIKGSVKPGFTVYSEGNMLIVGAVEAAKVTCLASLVVGGGVTGESARVMVGGTGEFAYVEHATVHGSGEVIVKKQIYYATVTACHGLRCEGNAQIIGSMVCAGGSLHLGMVDTPSSRSSLLAAAVDWERYEKYLELTGVVRQCELRIRELRYRLGPGRASKDIQKKEKMKLKALKKLENFNMVPVGSEYDVHSGIRHASAQKIEVSGKLLAGVEIRIGNVARKLVTDYSAGTFCYNQEKGCLEYLSADGKRGHYL